MASVVVNNRHQIDMCYDEIGLCAQRYKLLHVQLLTLNFLEKIVVLLDHLKSKHSTAQIFLYLSEILLLMVLRSHQYGSKYFLIFIICL